MSQYDHRGVTAIWADPSEQFAAMFTRWNTLLHTSTLTNLFVISKVAAVKPPHHGSDCMLARVVQRDRQWDLREYINLHRSAKYSSNFTPEWIKT